MASRPKVSAQKRMRERVRQERQKEKAVRRAESRQRRATTPRPHGEEDPDIAGIVPGPQASPWAEMGFAAEEEEVETEDEEAKTEE